MRTWLWTSALSFALCAGCASPMMGQRGGSAGPTQYPSATSPAFGGGVDSDLPNGASVGTPEATTPYPELEVPAASPVRPRRTSPPPTFEEEGQPGGDPGPMLTPGIETPGGARKVPQGILSDPDAAFKTPKMAQRAPRGAGSSRPGADYRNPGKTQLTARANSTSEINWKSGFRTQGGRALEWTYLGDGPEMIAVVASVHGNERQAQAMVNEWAEYVNSNPDQLANRRFLFIRTSNPDGLAAGSAYNMRGVDINRNFPSGNWAPLPGGRSGPREGSEAETRGLLQLLEDFHPSLLVHVKEIRGKGLVNADGGLRERVARIGKKSGWRQGIDLGSKTSGSMERYASTRLHCPAVTMLVPSETSTELAWTRNRDVLVMSLDDDTSRTTAELSIEEEDDDFVAGMSRVSRGAGGDPFNRQAPASAEPRRNYRGPGPGYLELAPSP